MKSTILGWTLAVTLLVPGFSEARVTRIEITRVESPTFGSMSFDAVGPYEKLVGRVYGEVDPAQPLNAGITDVTLAPKVNGKVQYSADIYILKPVDIVRGNRVLLYEVNNRGGKLAVTFFNNAAVVNDPTTAADAGDGFLMRHGYTIVWMGWDDTVLPGNNRLQISLPIATAPGGAPIVGPAMEELVIDNAVTFTGTLTYPAAVPDPSQATLTVRARQEDPRVLIPASGWEYVDARTIRLLPAGTPLQQGFIYELVYQATAPRVSGLSFAATRDVVAFLRRSSHDDEGHPNPVAGGVETAYGFGFSQGGRYVRDFLHLGFNQDESGHQVFDALMPMISGAGGGFFNYRFAQPGRSALHRRAHSYPEQIFPFAYPVLTDPVTGMTDGILERCLATGTCPKVFDTNSGNEYWFKDASLVHTDPLGQQDLPDPANVRFYFFSSLQHFFFGGATAAGICQQMTNPISATSGYRALLVALDQWARYGVVPPASRVPRRSDGTLVASLPQSSVGFPSIPGVTYNGLTAVREVLDYGPFFEGGILTMLPPAYVPGQIYQGFVPRTDADGNDLAGIRLVPIAVPLATYTGWGLRKAGFAENDECDQSGQFIPFLKTQAERLVTGDPRPSIEERYQNHGMYVSQVANAATQLVLHRFLLAEDAVQIVEDAAKSDIGKK